MSHTNRWKASFQQAAVTMMGFKNKWSEERENKYGKKKPKMIVKSVSG